MYARRFPHYAVAMCQSVHALRVTKLRAFTRVAVEQRDPIGEVVGSQLGSRWLMALGVSAGEESRRLHMSNRLRPGVLRIAGLALVVVLTSTAARAEDTATRSRIDFAKVVKHAIAEGAVSRQTQNTPAPRQAKSQKLKWILIGAGGAAGAALLAVGRGGGGSGTPSTPAEPAGTITLGAPSIGGPQ
jgi:hypothetical protein